MLKDQNNPKVLSAITDVIKSNRSEVIVTESTFNKELASRYNRFKPLDEAALSHKQKKIAKVAGHPGKIDAADFAALRAGKKVDEDFDIVIDEELEGLLEYEVVRGRDGKFYNDEGEAYDDHPPARRMRRGYTSGPSHKPAEAKPAGTHAVHINGKKWKSFGTEAHAKNVANKLVAQGKKATVHKEEYDANGQQIDEVVGALAGLAARTGPAIARGLSAVKNAFSKPAASPIVRDADKVAKIPSSARAVAEPGKITPRMTGNPVDAAGRYRTAASTAAPAAKSNAAKNVAAGAGAAGATVGAGLSAMGGSDRSVPKPIESSRAKEMATKQPAAAAKPAPAAKAPATKPMSDDERTQGKVGAELQRTSGQTFMSRADRLDQAKVNKVLGTGYKAGSAEANLALAKHYRDKIAARTSKSS